MIEKNELFNALVIDFSAAVKEYRKARMESELEENDYDDNRENRLKKLTTSKGYIKLTREEYWQQIIRAKIQVIACIGGIKTMQEFCQYLQQIDNELNLVRAFDYYADGICGWCR